MINRYKLDTKLTKEQEEHFWSVSAENASIVARRAKEYWNVIDQNIGLKVAIERLNEAYADKFDEYGIDFIDGSEYAFVTDNHDLAADLIRILELDFIYDFKADVFIFDIWACHEAWLSYLYEAIHGRVRDNDMRTRDVAELYVQKGYGIYQSSQSYRIMIGEEVAVPPFLSQFKRRFLRI